MFMLDVGLLGAKANIHAKVLLDGCRIFEEFKGTGNMELVLDRKLSEKRVFPAIDIAKSGTRREDLLFTPQEQEAMDIMRKAFNGLKAEEAVDNILNMFAHTANNKEFCAQLRKTRLF